MAVSVIIPCFNHGRYLAKAIQSVIDQNFPGTEIIVVDDGSTDDTANVASQFPTVHYIYQDNRGLSTARNTGIDNSTGSYLVFLDADDWLLKNALAINAAMLDHDRSLAFVSGAFLLSRPEGEQEVKTPVHNDHYLRLLQGNYIMMHATVMYQRKVFKTIRFDPSLKACEDYDVYLRVAREFPVSHHTQLLAAYWQHDSNMSSDLSLMLRYSLDVLGRQRAGLRTSVERVAYDKGIQHWKNYYALNIYARLVDVRAGLSRELRSRFLQSLWNNNRQFYFKYMLLFPLMPFRKFRKLPS